MNKFKPGLFVGGVQKMMFYTDANNMTASEARALHFETEEEAWVFLEARGELSASSCVKLPTNSIRFSGVNDKFLHDMKKRHPNNVVFIRKENRYMLKSLLKLCENS